MDHLLDSLDFRVFLTHIACTINFKPPDTTEGALNQTAEKQTTTTKCGQQAFADHSEKDAGNQVSRQKQKWKHYDSANDQNHDSTQHTLPPGEI